MVSRMRTTRGTRLTLAIQASPHTQAYLAEQLGISKQAMGDLVHGRSPGHRHLPALAALLDVPEAWLREGGDLPPKLSTAEGIFTAPTAEINFFLTTMRDAFLVLREMRSAHPDKYTAAMASLRSPMRLAVNRMALPGPLPLADQEFISVYEIARIRLNAGEKQLFVEGLEQARTYFSRQRRLLKISSGTISPYGRVDQSLPLDVFHTIRGALRVVKSERDAFARSSKDVDNALKVLWERQLTGPWGPELMEQLTCQKEEDLGNAKSAPRNHTPAE